MRGVNSVLFNTNALGAGHADALETLQQNRNSYFSSALSATLHLEAVGWGCEPYFELQTV